MDGHLPWCHCQVEVRAITRELKGAVEPLWHQIQLSPGFKISDWMAIRGELDPTQVDDLWSQVIQHFRNRLERRFLAPAALLLQDEGETQQTSFPQGLGFTVLAIDCLLIEALVGLESGRRTSAGQTAQAFQGFLTSAPRFAESFGDQDRGSKFVKAVRNGVLHDGETRHGWIVWQGKRDGPIVEALEEGLLVVNRSAFHFALETYVDSYFSRLKDPENVELRSSFKDRIDALCGESAPVG